MVKPEQGPTSSPQQEASPVAAEAGSTAAPRLRVQVVYAMPDEVWLRQVEVATGSTLQDALAASGFREAFPQIDPIAAGVGVFGIRRQADYVLADGDRVEVYRPLVFDPMESRRRRAAHKARRQS